MSYESPIKLIETMTENIADEMNKSVDEYIYKSVLKVGVEVDRDELIRALRYDRDQYEKGYRDGQNESLKRGMWIDIPNGNIKAWKRKCSACGMYHRGKTAFCPNCGADMMEVDEQ